MNKSFIFLTTLLIAISSVSPATGSTIVLPVSLPTELPQEWIRAMKKIQCKLLVAKALVGLESLLSLVGENEMRYVTFDEILREARIIKGGMNPLEYTCLRDEVAGILRIIYLQSDIYNALIEWNQMPDLPGMNDAHYKRFRRFGSQQMKLHLRNINFFEPFLYYVFVFKPLAGKPITDTRVGFVKHVKRGKEIVVPPKEAAMEIIRRLRDSLFSAIEVEYAGDGLQINNQPDMVESPKKRIFESTYNYELVEGMSERTNAGDLNDSQSPQSKLRKHTHTATWGDCEQFDPCSEDYSETFGLTSTEDTLPIVDTENKSHAYSQELHKDPSTNLNSVQDTVNWDEIVDFFSNPDNL